MKLTKLFRKQTCSAKYLTIRQRTLIITSENCAIYTLDKEVHTMRVTIDLEKDIIIIPDNFFDRVAKDNERLKMYGGKPATPIDRIKHSFKVAMADTDTRLLTKTNAKTSKVTKVPMGIDEADSTAGE